LTKTSPWSHSKILTSFLDEIVYLAWLLLHIFKEQMTSVDLLCEGGPFAFILSFWDVKDKKFYRPPQKIRDIFSGLSPSFLSPSSLSRNSISLNSSTNYSLKAGANV